MIIRNFLWDKLLAIIFNLAGLIAVSLFTAIMSGIIEAIIIGCVWLFILVIYITVSYLLLKRKIDRIKKAAYETEDKFLISEIVERPHKSEDSLYYELMILQGRAAIDKVVNAEKEKAEYRDYIQEWVHEIKMPITAAELICGNNKGDAFRGIALQLIKINNYVEQVLYETKSNNVAKDLMIKNTDLHLVAAECIKENKLMFINSGINIENNAEGIALSDEKWLGFILKQLLNNCVQYAKIADAEIKISTQKLPDGKMELSVWDNGVGILKSELPRIFDKGFTGSNGRNNKKSTGLGLYLCKKLCAALDISVSAESESGEYTRISLILPAKPSPNITKL